ncbi:MAG TPA: ATP-binding protein [Candidatus Saccharimonadales bacterium]|nr:ATP-binding protein [Candidatus Saccharimonadales bacterium]
MNKVVLHKPVMICLYGYPGSGKSYVARHLEEELQIAHVSADKIRHELFAHPRYDAQENAIIAHLMNYMTEEFLRAGVSVVYDINAMRSSQRKRLRELARQHKAEYVLVWLQVDIENAFLRTQRRDRRTQDDKYSEDLTKATFNKQISMMQNPGPDEDYLVISGKHSFLSQRSAILSRLYQFGAVTGSTVQNNITAPGLVNLVPNPNAGRVDLSRRNINIT